MGMNANPEISAEIVFVCFVLLVMAIVYMHISWRRAQVELDKATEEMRSHRVRMADHQERQRLGKRILLSARAGDTADIKRALELNADVNVQDTDTKATPLYVAAQQGHPEAVKHLLESRADVNVANRHGTTALAAAVKSTRLTATCRECVDILLEAGADTNVSNEDGDTAMLSACRARDADCIDTLLAHGARVQHTNGRGETPASLVGDDEQLAEMISAAAARPSSAEQGASPGAGAGLRRRGAAAQE